MIMCCQSIATRFSQVGLCFLSLDLFWGIEIRAPVGLMNLSPCNGLGLLRIAKGNHFITQVARSIKCYTRKIKSNSGRFFLVLFSRPWHSPSFQLESPVAGVRLDRSGQPVPTGLGRLCQWKSPRPAETFASYSDFHASLDLSCQKGESPGRLDFLPTADMPRQVFYQVSRV